MRSSHGPLLWNGKPRRRASDIGECGVGHLGECMARSEIEGTRDAEFGKNLKRGGPIDWRPRPAQQASLLWLSRRRHVRRHLRPAAGDQPSVHLMLLQANACRSGATVAARSGVWEAIFTARRSARIAPADNASQQNATTSDSRPPITKRSPGLMMAMEQ